MESLPPFVLAERNAIIAETYEAFADVSREGGVSWSEAYEIDCWKPPEEEQAARQSAARAKDLDASWTQLVEDPDWFGETGIGGWNFLDAIGFRYYLPAQMVRCLRESDEHRSEGFVSHLTLLESDPQDDFRIGLWSILDVRQRKCVTRFLQYMNIMEGRHADWNDAYRGYWKDFPDEPTASRP